MKNPQILVSPPGQVHDEDGLARQPGRALDDFRDSVGGFERGDDALNPRQRPCGIEGFFIAYVGIFRAALLMESCVFRSNRRIIQPC